MTTKGMTTPQHFELFKEECKLWIEYFGLKHFQVYYEHKDLSKNGGLAQAAWGYMSMNAVITLSTNWGDDLVDDEIANEHTIRQNAFHEVYEGLVLGSLIILAKSRFATLDEIEHTSHHIVRIMENTIFTKRDVLLGVGPKFTYTASAYHMGLPNGGKNVK